MGEMWIFAAESRKSTDSNASCFCHWISVECTGIAEEAYKRFASLASQKFLVCSVAAPILATPLANFVHPKAVVFAQRTL